MRRRFLEGMVLAVAGCAILGGAARAQGVQISPIMIKLQPGQMTTTVAVTNQGSSSMSVQVRPFRWTQVGATDTLTPTDQLAISPPITDIDAGQSQVFRVVLRQPAVGAEASYRLVLDQLPPPASPGSVRIALRLSVPIFAEPATRADPAITWRITAAPDGALLVGLNTGGQHVRITGVVLSEAGRAPLNAVPRETPYILPGAERSWRIVGGKRLRAGTTVRLAAVSDAGRIDTTVHVGRP